MFSITLSFFLHFTAHLYYYKNNFYDPMHVLKGKTNQVTLIQFRFCLVPNYFIFSRNAHPVIAFYAKWKEIKAFYDTTTYFGYCAEAAIVIKQQQNTIKNFLGKAAIKASFIKLNIQRLKICLQLRDC